MLNITEQQKIGIEAAQRSAEVLNILRDNIAQLLKIGLNKKTVLKLINTQFNKNINYNTFVTYLRKHNISAARAEKLNSEREATNVQTKANDNDNPFNLLNKI